MIVTKYTTNGIIVKINRQLDEKFGDNKWIIELSLKEYPKIAIKQLFYVGKEDIVKVLHHPVNNKLAIVSIDINNNISLLMCHNNIGQELHEIVTEYKEKLKTIKELLGE